MKETVNRTTKLKVGALGYSFVIKFVMAQNTGAAF